MDINKAKLIHNLQLTFKDDGKSSANLWVRFSSSERKKSVELNVKCDGSIFFFLLCYIDER